MTEPERRGQVLVRMPPALHQVLAAEAERQGVSINQLAVALIAGGLRFKMPADKRPRAKGGER